MLSPTHTGRILHGYCRILTLNGNLPKIMEVSDPSLSPVPPRTHTAVVYSDIYGF